LIERNFVFLSRRYSAGCGTWHRRRYPFLARSEAFVPSRAACASNLPWGHLRLGFTAGSSSLAKAAEQSDAHASRCRAHDFRAIDNVRQSNRNFRCKPRFTSPARVHWLGFWLIQSKSSDADTAPRDSREGMVAEVGKLRTSRSYGPLVLGAYRFGCPIVARYTKLFASWLSGSLSSERSTLS